VNALLAAIEAVQTRLLRVLGALVRGAVAALAWALRRGRFRAWRRR
jgi:hypothetical protein